MKEGHHLTLRLLMAQPTACFRDLEQIPKPIDPMHGSIVAYMRIRPLSNLKKKLQAKYTKTCLKPRAPLNFAPYMQRKLSTCQHCGFYLDPPTLNRRPIFAHFL
jgi:hypothetical protein